MQCTWGHIQNMTRKIFSSEDNLLPSLPKPNHQNINIKRRFTVKGARRCQGVKFSEVSERNTNFKTSSSKYFSRKEPALQHLNLHNKVGIQKIDMNVKTLNIAKWEKVSIVKFNFCPAANLRIIANKILNNHKNIHNIF